MNNFGLPKLCRQTAGLSVFHAHRSARGFISRVLVHLLLTGSFRPSAVYAMPLISVFVLFAVADAESFFSVQWRQQIASRIATGKLRHSFCFCLGVVIGIAIYPIEWSICRHMFDDAVRAKTLVAIALAIISVAASAFIGWYLLTKYPRTNDAA